MSTIFYICKYGEEGQPCYTVPLRVKGISAIRAASRGRGESFENLLQYAGVEGHYGRKFSIGGEIPTLSY